VGGGIRAVSAQALTNSAHVGHICRDARKQNPQIFIHGSTQSNGERTLPIIWAACFGLQGIRGVHPPLFWYRCAMTSLKSYLYGVAPILGLTPAALYERQRALVKLGLLTATPGRGPGSGVPLTAENVAAVLISVLASDSLSDVDQRVVALCEALPDADAQERRRWKKHDGPTFRSEVARVLSGQRIQSGPSHPRPDYRAIRVSRCWRGQIMRHVGPGLRAIDFFVDGHDRHAPRRQISVTAEIEPGTFEYLIVYTHGALSQTTEPEEEEAGDEGAS
jgi:hypothetical protein